MSVPPVPPVLEQLGRRTFSFSPAILNTAHNEWFYRRATWSEILVQNLKTQEEVWVPRIYLAGVTQTEHPVIVGLRQELEFRAGVVRPAGRRVIEMPRAVNDVTAPRWREAEPGQPADVVAIRLDSGYESRFGRVLLAGIAIGITGCVLAVSVYRGGIIGNRLMYPPAQQRDFGLGAGDDYASVTRLLGKPARDSSRSDLEGYRYRVLVYPRRGFSVVLMSRVVGVEPSYIGAMDGSWNPLHAVEMPGGGNSYPILRTLARMD